MSHPKKPTPADTLDPTIRRDMAAHIRTQYMPIAFNCGCGGEHPTCSRAKEDPRNWAQFDVIERIARWLEGTA